MIASTIAFISLAITKPRQKRVFHYITAAITMVAAVAYFSMASHLGWTGIPVEYQRDDPKVAGVNREIYYVRYVSMKALREVCMSANTSSKVTSTGLSPPLSCFST